MINRRNPVLYLHYFFFTLSIVSFIFLVLFLPLYIYRFFFQIRDLPKPIVNTADIFPRGSKIFLPALIVCLLSLSIRKALDNGMNDLPLVDTTSVLFVINAGIVAWYYYLCCTRKS